MRVQHLSWLLSSAGGGIPPVIFSLAKEQRLLGVDASALGVADPDAHPIDSRGVPFAACAARGPIGLGYAPALGAAMRAGRPDLLHLHGLFTWSSNVSRRWGQREGKPVVASPHGMLEPWALANSAWKKRLFRLLVEDDNLRRAACLQALNMSEARNFRALGLRNPVAIVPNGIDLPAEDLRPDAGALRRRIPDLPPGRLLLFLGRIHPKKGLPQLVDAWSRLDAERRLEADNWTLLIAGPDQLDHESEVKRCVEARGLGGRIRVTGPLYGEAKAEAFAAADAFVLPSFSEGFSMAVLEAMAWRLPVLITRACNFDVETPGAGLLCEPEPVSIADGLRDLLGRSPVERAALGIAGRRLVERDYTWRAVATSMIAVYAWLLEGGQRPAWVEVLR